MGPAGSSRRVGHTNGDSARSIPNIHKGPVRFAKVPQLHDDDLIPADDPNRSPRPPSAGRRARRPNTKLPR
jgi:hypothetical protein